MMTHSCSRVLPRCLFILAPLFVPAASALTITSTTTSGVALVDAITGTGVSVDSGSISYIGATDQSGFFTGGLSSGLGFDSGIIMTTGNAYDAPGPNSAPNTSTTTGTGSDPDLDAIIWIPSGQPPSTYDKAVLEFTFTTSGGDLFFNFQFASEEYNEYLGGFNDPFALFVDGVNVGLLPDDSPVAINNVNCGNPAGTVGPNCEYFNNNDDGAYDLEYDGFSDVFTASVTGLAAGDHTMKFAIADGADTIFDSAIFIQAESFSNEQTPEVSVPSAAWFFLTSISCLFARKRKALS